MQNGVANMDKRSKKTNQMGKIHRYSYEIRAIFVRIWSKFHNAPIFTHSHSREICTKLVRISYAFNVNFVHFGNKESKQTSKHTLPSHGHVIDHALPFEHLGNCHAGAAFARCHSVLGCTGGATPEMAKWISDSASTLSPLQTSSWCTLPTKKSMHFSPTSMTARLEAGADREGKVGWKGQVGGPAGTASGASAKRVWATPPSHNPTLPTAAFPNHNTWFTLGKSWLDKSPETSRAFIWGGGVQVSGVRLVVVVLGIGGPQVKKSTLQPILGVKGGGQPVVAAGGNHEQHPPPLQLNGVPARLSRLSQGRPRLHRHLVVL